MPKKGDAYKDYSLLGPYTKINKEKGLAAAEWYTSPIDRKRLKELMKRKNWPGIRDTIMWFGALIGLGYIGYITWGTWWSLLVFVIYGLVYYTFAHSRWHECAHYTALKSDWLNESLYYLVCFATFRLPTYWRWEHTRHHTDTQIVGHDTSINTPRPINFLTIFMNVFSLDIVGREILRAMRAIFGRLTEPEKDFIPATERRKVFWEALIYILIYAAVVAWCISIGSILPLLYVGLPTLYGAWLSTSTFFLIEHGGLHEDVLDHRMCTRTFYMNPIFRFLHGNMNYHLEHHMFPMIPYHALPSMHEEIKVDCPKPNKGLWNATIETYTAFLIQRRDPSYTIPRPLPSTARPYSPLGPHVEKVAPAEAKTLNKIASEETVRGVQSEVRSG